MLLMCPAATDVVHFVSMFEYFTDIYLPFKDTVKACVEIWFISSSSFFEFFDAKLKNARQEVCPFVPKLN